MSDKFSSLPQKVKELVPISQIIGQNVKLRPSGSGKTGLCPFHQEKTPSFHVKDDEGFYKCFGCNAFGDHFDFLMNLRKIPFTEALGILCEMAGVKKSSSVKPKAADEPVFQGYFAITNRANILFQKQLSKEQEALDYLLKNRKLSEKMLEQASLGFCRGFVFDSVKQRPKLQKKCMEIGLITSSDQKCLFDNRITFPIRNFHGQVLGFGGRTLSESKLVPKYLNSPQSPIFHKKQHFYGEWECHDSLRQGIIPIIVEGYFDAMAYWAAGVPALALLGTSLGKEHLKALKRFTTKVILGYDMDSSGVRALYSSLKLIFEENFLAQIVLLEHKDAGEYMAKGELELLRSKVNNAKDAFCVVLDMAAIKAQKSIAARMEEMEQLLPVFRSIQGGYLRNQYISYFAKKMNEEPSGLFREIEAKRKRNQQSKPKPEEAKQQVSMPLSYKILCQIAFFREQDAFMDRELLENLPSFVAEKILYLLRIKKTFNISELKKDFAYKDIFQDFLIFDFTQKDCEDFIASTKKDLKKQSVRLSLQKSLVSLKNAEESKKYDEVLDELKRRSKILTGERKNQHEGPKKQEKPSFEATPLKPAKIKAKKPSISSSIYSDEEEWL